MLEYFIWLGKIYLVCVCMYSCICTHTDLHTPKMHYYLRVYETIHNIKIRLPTRLNKSPSATKIMWLKTNPTAPNLMPHQVKGNCFLITVWWITEGSASIMKEMMVKQPVKVNHTEGCPGISEIFFFWLSQANRSGKSCKPFEFGLWRAQFTGQFKSDSVILLMKYADPSSMVKLLPVWGNELWDRFSLNNKCLVIY